MSRWLVFVALAYAAPAAFAGGREQKFPSNLPIRVLHGNMVEAKPGTSIFTWATGRPVEVKKIPGFSGFFKLPHEGQYSFGRSLSFWRWQHGGFKFEKGRLEETPAPVLAWDDDEEDD